MFVALGPFLFQTAAQAIQPLQNEYSIIRDGLSALVFGPYGWIQTGAFYLFGLTLFVLALSLVIKLKVKFNPGIIFLGLAGVCFFLIGFYHARLPGAPNTIGTMIHENSTFAVVVLFPLACFFLAPLISRRGHSILYYYTIFAGVFAFLFFFLGGLFLVNEMSLLGLFERVMLWNADIWIEITCAVLIIHEFNKRRSSVIPQKVG